MSRLLVLNAHALDLMTLMLVLPLYGAAGEYGVGFGVVYPLTGIVGVIALKGIGAALLAVIVGRSQLRLTLAVLAGLAGAAVNAVAWRVIA